MTNQQFLESIRKEVRLKREGKNDLAASEADRRNERLSKLPVERACSMRRIGPLSLNEQIRQIAEKQGHWV